MNLRDFRRAGHSPTLLAPSCTSTSASWSGCCSGRWPTRSCPDFGLSDAAEGPDGGGAAAGRGGAAAGARLADRPHRRSAYRPAGHGADGVPLLLGWLWADSFGKVLLVGLLLGVAGASFAAALPLASRWYPPQYQGLAMGIAGAGNSGTALATFFGPRLARGLGWHAVFGLALVPLLADPRRVRPLRQGQPAPAAAAPLRAYAEVLRLRRHLVVLPLLLGHVRRVRRAGELPEHLLPRPVRAAADRGGRFRDALRDRGLASCGRWAATWPTGSAASGC